MFSSIVKEVRVPVEMVRIGDVVPGYGRVMRVTTYKRAGKDITSFLGFAEDQKPDQHDGVLMRPFNTQRRELFLIVLRRKAAFPKRK